jgi:S-adenosylmethionine decarboxylase
MGKLLIAELIDIDWQILNDLANVQKIAKEAALAAGASIIGEISHKFDPQGVTVIGVAESHLSIHTWPESNYAAVDIFFCGQILDPQDALDYIAKMMNATVNYAMLIDRGIHSSET